MNFRKSTVILCIAAAVPMAGLSVAYSQPTKGQTQERIYGSQLMTQQERNEHRAQMRQAKTPEERERIRAEHHERMKERARERGITLPDVPPATPGRGMGQGGMGQGGMGQGGMGQGGMGPGGGRR